MKNRIKELLKNGEVALGTWITTASTDMVEVVAFAGFDYLVFDTEHAPLTFETVQSLMQVAGTAKITPIVRVAWNDQVLMKLALDIGSHGLMVPQVNSKDDADRAVRGMRYPPRGVRGIGPRRASHYYQAFADYLSFAETEVMTIVQIEHADAISNVEEIASVEGVDALFIGPADLSASMGLLGKYDHPKVSEAIDRVLSVAKKRGIPAGIHTLNPQDANKRIADGFQLIVIGTDVGFLANGCAQTLQGVNRQKSSTK